MNRDFGASTFDASMFDPEAGTPEQRAQKQAIAIGPEFEQWLVQKSYSLLQPICRMGMLVVALVMLAWDPMIYLNRMWEKSPQYLYLVAWQSAIFLFFLAYFCITRFTLAPGRERLVLASALALGQLLFTWFAFISWQLSGDLSIYAVATIVIACVFSMPGHWRKLLYVGSALLLAASIYASGKRPEFISNGEFVNLIVVVVIAFVIDGFMMNLSRALYRRQRMVEIERARADDILYNALPASIADELKRNNIVKAEKYDRMTVLFADIVGFTQFSSGVPPDALVYVLNQIFTEFDSLVDAHGVEKIKTIGDAYMVIGKDNAAGVADLALQLLRAIDAYNRRNGVSFALRIGMHTGPTVAGVIGLKRFLYDVWGDAVNTASRMESFGTSGRIHVSDTVQAELAGQFDFESRGEMDIKGKGRMTTYFLLGRQAAPN